VTDPVVSIQTQSGQILGVGTYERFPVVDREAMAHTPIEFVGGVDRPRTDWERTLSKTMGWNKYGMTFEIPKQTDGEIYVALPRMLLDTHAVPVPRFRFRQAIEEHCSVHSFGT
jgi:hypothetical protein